MIRTTLLLKLLALISVLMGCAKARVEPELAIGITSKNIFGKPETEITGVFEPNVKLRTTGTYGGFDYEGGVNVKSVDSKGNTPYSLWGKAMRSIAEGWNVAARFDCDSEDLHCIDLDVRVNRADSTTKARVQGTVDTLSRTGEVTELGLSQSLDVLGGNLILAPSYRIPARKADLVISYEVQDTTVTVGGDMDKQRVTISQKFGDNNAVAPTVTSEGEIDLEYRRNVGKGVVTAAYKPNDVLSVQYKEGPWVASVEAPLDGFYKVGEGGAKVSLRRAVQVETF